MQSFDFYINHPALICDSIIRKFGRWLPDDIYIKLRYRLQMAKKLNITEPKTFQEKIQWLKLHDHNPFYTTLVDKVLVKDYVSSKVGSQFVIPLLGVWDKPEDIDWNRLPCRFVLKTNHSGGNTGVIICRDKSTFDKKKAIEKLSRSLRCDVYHDLREWPYKNIEKKVFAEEFIEVSPDMISLPDFKWYCFNGEPKYCQVIQDRTTKETIDFFDTNWRHQEFIGLNPTAVPASSLPTRPLNLDVQLSIASELSKDLPFSRIDLYEVGERVYFGEITFYPASGLGSFRPDQYNELLGDMIALPFV